MESARCRLAPKGQALCPPACQNAHGGRSGFTKESWLRGEGKPKVDDDGSNNRDGEKRVTGTTRGAKTTTCAIVFAIPDKRMSAHPNRKHWQKTIATKEQRELGYALAKQAMAEVRDTPWEPASVLFAFYWPDKRRRDEINYMQMMKGAVDGIVDAGLIAGDDWQRLQCRGAISQVDRENPRVELLFSKLEMLDE